MGSAAWALLSACRRFQGLMPSVTPSLQDTVENHSSDQETDGLMLKLELQYFGHLIQRADSLEKILMLGKIEGRKRRGQQEDEMVGWHH